MSSKHLQAHALVSQGVFDSISTFREFEQRVSALFDTNTKAQGDAFEIFVESYLATQLRFPRFFVFQEVGVMLPVSLSVE